MRNILRLTIRQTRYRAALLTMILLAASLSIAGQNIRPGFNIFSPQQDYEIGRQSALVANRQMQTFSDARITRIGRRLAAAAPGARFPYEFRVVNNSAINAFALPGGFVYINRGALNAARSEDEIAAVLAHEISHVALRHGTNQASRASVAQAGLGLISGLLGGRAQGGLGQVLGIVGGFGLNALFLKNSRTAESEADLLGARIMQRAGYNPYGMISFLETIQRNSGGRSIEFLSDHPNPGNRIARLQQELGYARRGR